MDIDCNNCGHLNMTENEQTDNTRPHVCKFYKMRVLHNSILKPRSVSHYRLYPCGQCNDDINRNFKLRDNNNKLDFVYEQACPDCEIVNATDKSDCMQGGDLCCSKCGQVLLTKEELDKMDFFAV